MILDLRLGRHLGKALYEYYKQINIIAPLIKTTDNKSNKKKRHKIRRHTKRNSPKLPIKNLHKPLYLEPRIFSPSIIKPRPDVDLYIRNNQLPNHGFPTAQKKTTSQKSAKLARNKCSTFRDGNYSPPPSLTIIDLNNTIRNGLAQLKSGHGDKYKNISKKDILKQQFANEKYELFSSDDD